MHEQEWSTYKSQFQVGESRRVRVAAAKIYGLFVTLEDGNEGFIDGLNLSKKGYTTEEFSIGQEFEALILGFRDRNRQVELDLPQRIK